MNASFQFQMVKADVQQVGGNALRNILLFVHRMAFIESTSFISRWLILPSNMMHPQQDRVTALKTLRVLNEDRVALPGGVYSGLYSTAVWFDRAATKDEAQYVSGILSMLSDLRVVLEEQAGPDDSDDDDSSSDDDVGDDAGGDEGQEDILGTMPEAPSQQALDTTEGLSESAVEMHTLSGLCSV